MSHLAEQILGFSSKVETAFPVDPVPAREALISCGCTECADLGGALAGRRWSELPPEILQEQAMALPLLTAVGFLYYSPAFLLGAVREGGDPFLDWVLYAVCPSSRERWEWRFSIWTDEQKAVVNTWLRLVLENESVFGSDEAVGRSGYETYWRAYER